MLVNVSIRAGCDTRSKDLLASSMVTGNIWFASRASAMDSVRMKAVLELEELAENPPCILLCWVSMVDPSTGNIIFSTNLLTMGVTVILL